MINLVVKNLIVSYDYRYLQVRDVRASRINLDLMIFWTKKKIM